jgi:prolyl 4-hydroxylase
VGNGEGMQVLRYGPQQKYDGHFDYFFDKQSVQNGGNRYATVLM